MKEVWSCTRRVTIRVRHWEEWTQKGEEEKGKGRSRERVSDSWNKKLVDDDEKE